MLLGVCTKPENVWIAAQAGFDYVECGLSALHAMPEDAYQALLKQKDAFPIPVLKCNGFMPGDVHPVGPQAREEKRRAYTEKALSRAHALGIRLAVFGSGAARAVPAGWSHDEAWRQIVAFLKLTAEYGEKYDIDIAIEPLRRQECNILNLVSEGTAAAAVVNDRRVGVLGDTFHMRSSFEPWDALTYAGKKLKHIHISHTLPDLSKRVFPASGDGEDYAEIFETLRAMDYPGDVSVEAGCDDLLKDGRKAVACLKPLM